MRDLNAIPLPELLIELTRGADLRTLLEIARREDLGDPPVDVTSEALIRVDATGSAVFAARRPGVVAGLGALHFVVEVFAPDCTLEIEALDGDHVSPGAEVATLSGPLRQVLATERTALNLLCRLSGVATMTAEYVRLVEASSPTHAPKICDTRKTTPGWRALEKYAVRCGGGWLHRCGLHDAMLIKDNHLAALRDGNVFERLALILREARAQRDLRFVELEVDSLDQFERALGALDGLIDLILLDNMSPDQMRDAVALRNRRKSRTRLEASGGVALKTVGAIAASGVDRISVGALTHSAPALDFGLDLR